MDIIKRLQDKNNCSVLKFKTWNIDGKNFGKKRGQMGDKLEHGDFLQEVQGYDVVTLLETHAKGLDMCIPGFHKPFRKDRLISKKGNKSFGGIAVFVRQELWNRKVITEVPNKSNDAIWLKISKNHVSVDCDIFYGSVYLPPKNKWNKANIEDRVKTVFDEIEKFSQKGEILLSGDFNARTNNAADFVSLSDENQVGTESPIQRNSEDRKKCCKRGKEVIQVCKYVDLLILNGRKIGDLFGKMTCFRSNGCSVVDYGICSRDLFDNCTFFKVEELIPVISDHCPTTMHLSCELAIERGTHHFSLQDIDPGFFWSDESPIKLKETLRHGQINEEFQRLN